MPKTAIFFSIILLTATFANSYGYLSGDSTEENFVTKNYDKFDSGILDFPPDFFSENKFKRYVVFGSGQNNFDFLKPCRDSQRSRGRSTS